MFLIKKYQRILLKISYSYYFKDFTTPVVVISCYITMYFLPTLKFKIDLIIQGCYDDQRSVGLLTKY